jgi:hypothetical protein
MVLEQLWAVSEIGPVFKASTNVDPGLIVAASFGLKSG